MGKGQPIMNFLVAYSGSKESKEALDLAIDHASLFKAKVFVITSMEGGRSEKPDDIARVNQELKLVGQKLADAGVAHEVHEMARGLSPGEDIVIFAEDNDIDQIFVGIEKKSRTRKLLLGSTAQYIILKATCPVTTIK
jgi:nucleotide-binding universal stress UspA family protein